ncbi:MAG: alpha-glucan phosphorylase [Gemmataceae bacterium]
MTDRRWRTFVVLPQLPERLQPLQRLAYNLWWSWNPDAVFLFRRIDPELFETVEHSPVKLLGQVAQSRLDELQQDDGFLAHMDRVCTALDEYLAGSTWYREVSQRKPGAHEAPICDASELRIAYFSAEFGIHESIPVYSGGLGVLAGDTLKSASDLGLPLCGVSLMYRLGYFRQYLNQDGWQQEFYPENDFFNLPLIPEWDSQGQPLTISVPFPGREVYARIWRIQVGRVPLYLLDTNVPQNSPEDRGITGQLYGGDQDMRVRQEMILGIGGIRALHALGLPPTVCHMNEGHSAFLGLERIRMLMTAHGLSFAEAREVVAAGNVFTTHTPVPAGNDMFPPHLVQHYLSPYLQQVPVDWGQILALGRQNPHDPNEPFCMTILALRLAGASNGVSKLHGRVARHMWRNLWPSVPESEVPIFSITNGIHTQSWLSPEMTQLYDRYLGTRWRERPTDHDVWKRIDAIPDAELWRTHERRRERLVAYVRRRLIQQLRRRGAPQIELKWAEEALDPETLTIGFARRFATYKRGTLILRNLERLQRIINDKERPVQIIFAGKAHPRDHGGKELIKEIVHVARRPEFRRRIVFVEDYDMNLARYLVQGVDVWLNNPRRPLEASGTSGMKVVPNGGLNLSILDGWWVEGYSGDNGWAIGAGEEYTDYGYQDEVESRAIYDLLEEEIVPLFYTRGSDGVPREWVQRVKRSIRTICGYFNTNRMIQEYAERCYFPAHRHFATLTADGAKQARQLHAWRRRIEDNWSKVRVEHVEARASDPLRVGNSLQVQARVHLGDLHPEDVEVQVFHGLVDSLGDIPHPETLPMHPVQATGNGLYEYRADIPCRTTGQHGYAVRILPHHPDLLNPLATGLICWG